MLADLSPGTDSSVIGDTIFVQNWLLFWVFNTLYAANRTDGRFSLPVSLFQSETNAQGVFATWDGTIYTGYGAQVYRISFQSSPIGVELVLDLSTLEGWTAGDELRRMKVSPLLGFALLSARGSGIWAFDGTNATLVDAQETMSGSSLDYGGFHYFVSGSRALWRTNGVVTEVYPMANVRRLFPTPWNDRIFLLVDRSYIFSIDPNNDVETSSSSLQHFNLSQPESYYGSDEFYGFEPDFYESVPGYEGMLFSFPGSIAPLVASSDGIRFFVNGVGPGISNSLQLWQGPDEFSMKVVKISNVEPSAGERLPDGRSLLRTVFPDQVWIFDGVEASLLAELPGDGSEVGDSSIALLNNDTLVLSGSLQGENFGVEALTLSIPNASLPVPTGFPSISPVSSSSLASAVPSIASILSSIPSAEPNLALTGIGSDVPASLTTGFPSFSPLLSVSSTLPSAVPTKNTMSSSVPTVEESPKLTGVGSDIPTSYPTPLPSYVPSSFEVPTSSSAAVSRGASVSATVVVLSFIVQAFAGHQSNFFPSSC